MQPGRVPSQGGAQKLLHASWNTKENWPNYFVKEKGQVPIREPERERERDVSTWSTIAAAFSYLLPLVIAPTRRPTNTFTAPLPWLDNPSGPSARPLRRRAPLLLLGSSGSSMAGSPTLRIQLIILSLLSYYNPLILQGCNNVAKYMRLRAREGKEGGGGRMLRHCELIRWTCFRILPKPTCLAD